MIDKSELEGAKIPLGELNVGPRLGEGGFGVVHAATVTGIDYEFAIKILDPHPFNSSQAAARERFFREAELLLKLRHPRIIAIYGVGEHEGKPYILMERFAGMDLVKARDAVGSPPPESVLPFIEFVAEALAFAHSRGVVHRDIKPKNLMALKGDARVLDFGIAALLDPEGNRLTKTGGTFQGDAFSAPELVEDPRTLDARCDIYSLGASWFWLLTGKAPKGLNWEAALRGSVKVSHDYERVLLRCLDQVQARYLTMDELVAEIRALRSGGKPNASANVPSDDDALLLGVIGSLCATPKETASLYYVEQQLKGGMGRLAMGVAIRRLIRFALVESFVENDHNDNEIEMIRLTKGGEEWIERFQKRIEALMKTSVVETAAGGTDGLPF